MLTSQDGAISRVMLPEPQFLIYVLVDPRTREWRYIGKSSSGLRRPKSHVFSSRLKKDTSHKASWIKGLRAKGLDYLIDVIETFGGPEKLDEAEIEWIAAARHVGCRLTNLTAGGDGRTAGFKQTAEAREKMSKSRRGVPKSSEHAAKLASRLREMNVARRGIKLTEEHKTNLVANRKPQIFSEERLAKMRARATGRRHSEKTKKILSERRIGTKRSPESILKQSRTLGGLPFVDQTGRVYSTQREAARALGIPQSSIARVLHGFAGQVRGHVFRYLDGAQ